MSAYIRYLILAVLVLVNSLTVMGGHEKETSAASEFDSQEDADLTEVIPNVSNGNLNLDEHLDFRQSLKCGPPGSSCNVACDCCQHGDDSYDCIGNGTSDGRKYCTTTQPPPLPCPDALGLCFAIDAPCGKDCDCCQQQDGKPHLVTCYTENNDDSTKGLCVPHHSFVIDCFPPPPPTKP